MRVLAASLLLFALDAAGQPPGGKSPPGPKPKGEAKPKPKIKDPCIIKVTTTTGQGNRWAGSDTARVYVLINGEPDKKYRLTHKNKPFQRGATDKFELRVDLDPALVESVRLVNESADMWKCEAITLQFFKGGKESRVYRHAPAQYLSTAPERKALHAKPYVDLKMKVSLEEPKPKQKAGADAP